MFGMFSCSICKKRFGPRSVTDPEYESRHKGAMVIQRFTEIYELTDNLVLCPDCAKKISEYIEELKKKV